MSNRDIKSYLRTKSRGQKIALAGLCLVGTALSLAGGVLHGPYLPLLYNGIGISISAVLIFFVSYLDWKLGK